MDENERVLAAGSAGLVGQRVAAPGEALDAPVDLPVGRRRIGRGKDVAGGWRCHDGRPCGYDAASAAASRKRVLRCTWSVSNLGMTCSPNSSMVSRAASMGMSVGS